MDRRRINRLELDAQESLELVLQKFIRKKMFRHA